MNYTFLIRGEGGPWWFWVLMLSLSLGVEVFYGNSFIFSSPSLLPHFTKNCSMEEGLCPQFQNQTAVTQEWGPWLEQLYLSLLMLSADGFMCVDSGCVYLHISSCGECGSVAVWSLELWGFVYICISSFRCFMTRQPPLGNYWKQTQQLQAPSNWVLPAAFLNT